MRVRRGVTIGELRWPETEEFEAVAARLRENALQTMVSAIWRGYDLLVAEVLVHIDARQADEDVERSITQYLEPRIRRCLDPFLPFYCQHGYYEHATRLAPPAQPPTYDIAFVLYENPRVAWPLEAKVVRTPRQLAGYLADIREQFLTCRYAPFSAGGAMLAYLFRGAPDEVLDNIETALGVSLQEFPLQPPRYHRTSDHERTLRAGISSPRRFRCHHLVLKMISRPACISD